jgi:hypothetical protein
MADYEENIYDPLLSTDSADTGNNAFAYEVATNPVLFLDDSVFSVPGPTDQMCHEADFNLLQQTGQDQQALQHLDNSNVQYTSNTFQFCGASTFNGSAGPPGNRQQILQYPTDSRIGPIGQGSMGIVSDLNQTPISSGLPIETGTWPAQPNANSQQAFVLDNWPLLASSDLSRSSVALSSPQMNLPGLSTYGEMNSSNFGLGLGPNAPLLYAAPMASSYSHDTPRFRTGALNYPCSQPNTMPFDSSVTTMRSFPPMMQNFTRHIASSDDTARPSHNTLVPAHGVLHQHALDSNAGTFTDSDLEAITRELPQHQGAYNSSAETFLFPCPDQTSASALDHPVTPYLPHADPQQTNVAQGTISHPTFNEHFYAENLQGGAIFDNDTLNIEHPEFSRPYFDSTAVHSLGDTSIPSIDNTISTTYAQPQYVHDHTLQASYVSRSLPSENNQEQKKTSRPSRGRAKRIFIGPKSKPPDANPFSNRVREHQLLALKQLHNIKGVPEDSLGVMQLICSGETSDTEPNAKRRRTVAERENKKAVEQAGGSCFVCSYFKKKVRWRPLEAIFISLCGHSPILDSHIRIFVSGIQYSEL